MPLTIHNYSQDLTGHLLEQLQHVPFTAQRVMVPRSADVLLLRRSLKPFTMGLLPSIEPISRQLDHWLTLALGEDPTRLWLSRKERRFALTWWLRDRASRAPSDQPPSGQRPAPFAHATHSLLDLSFTQNHAQHVEVLDKLLEYGQSECLDWQEVDRKTIGYELNVTDFLAWCRQRNWMDPSQKYGLAEQAGWHALAEVVEDAQIHVVHHPMLSPMQERLLKAVMEHTSDRVHWHWYILDADITLTIPEPIRAEGLEGKPSMRLVRAHDRLEELEWVFRCIKSELLAAAAKGHTLALSDYVILTPDYTAYASRIPVMEHRFGLPVSIEQGPALKGDPALAKIRTYLYLEVKGFRIDDLADVFADQALNLPGLSIPEASSPNWRTFHAMCRRYNLRTLDEFDTQLERVITREAERERELQLRRMRTPTAASGDMESHAGHGDFYRRMRQYLLALRMRFRTAPSPLSEWYAWALEMLDALGTVDDAALTVAIRTMRHQLQQGLGTIRRLALDPVLTLKEVYETMETLLDESLAVSKHPGKILFAPLESVYLVSGKRLFVIGMTDRAYPPARDPEHLFPGLDGTLHEYMRRVRTTDNDDGKALIGGLMRQSAQCMLSYPQIDGRGRAMISSVLTEPETDFPEFLWQTEPPALPEGLEIMDHLQQAALFPGVHPEAEFDVDDRGKHAQLVAAIAQFRNDPEQIHLWEGQLSTDVPQWKGAVQHIVDRLWQSQLRNKALPMSVTRFDEYAASPLAYFLTRVLRLSIPEKYNDEAEQNRKGDLLHAIFEQFYRQDIRLGPPIDPRLDPEGARKRILGIAETLFEERVEDLGYPDTPYPELLRHQIRKVIDKFIDLERVGFCEFHDEVRNRVRPGCFHTAVDPLANPQRVSEQQPATAQALDTIPPLATEVPFSFDLDMEGYRVIIQGFIDRIDTDPDDQIRILFDYKTGGTMSLKSFQDQINPGLSFQLPIYLSAQMRDVKRSVLAGYYHVDISKMGRTMELKYLFGNKSLTNNLKNKTTHAGVLPEETLNIFMEQIVEHRIKNIVRAIKEGRFHQSLTTPNPYSEVSRMTRYSKSIAELRHLTLLQAYPQANEVFKHYYVRRPIITTGSEHQRSQEEVL